MSVSRRGLFIGGSALLIGTAISTPGTAHDGNELAPIIERGVLRIAVPGFDSPPFFFADGEALGGLDVELGHGIAAALEVAAVFDRTADTFDGAVERVTRGDADLAICKLSRTLHRGRVIRYSRPYAEIKQGLITNRVRFAELADGRSSTDVIRSFNGDLGVIAGSSFAEFARRNFPDATLHLFATWPELVAAVSGKAVDAAYRDDFEIKKLFIDNPSLTVVAQSVTLTDKQDTLAIGIRHDAPRLAGFVELFLELSDFAGPLSTDDILSRYQAGGGG